MRCVLWWKDSLQGGTISRQLTCKCFDLVNVTHYSHTFLKRSHTYVGSPSFSEEGDGFCWRLRHFVAAKSEERKQ